MTNSRNTTLYSKSIINSYTFEGGYSHITKYPN